MKKLLFLLVITGSVLCEESSQEQPKSKFIPNNDTLVTGSNDGSITVWDIKGNKLYSLRNTDDKIKYLLKKQIKQKRSVSVFQEALKTFGARFYADMQG